MTTLFKSCAHCSDGDSRVSGVCRRLNSPANAGNQDGVVIAKYHNIRLMQDVRSASDLHRNDVHSMLAREEQFVPMDDGIAAVHQNILEQHYAK